MHNSLFGKQESQESIQESRNQAKISKDSRITSIKIQSCGPLGYNSGIVASQLHLVFQVYSMQAKSICIYVCTHDQGLMAKISV